MYFQRTVFQRTTEDFKKSHLFVFIIQKSNIKCNIENAVFEQKYSKNVCLRNQPARNQPA